MNQTDILRLLDDDNHSKRRYFINNTKIRTMSMLLQEREPSQGVAELERTNMMMSPVAESDIEIRTGIQIETEIIVVIMTDHQNVTDFENTTVASEHRMVVVNQGAEILVPRDRVSKLWLLEH